MNPDFADILSALSAAGVEFGVTVQLAGGEVDVLSKADFIANKTAVGRPKDLADMALLDEADGRDR